MSLAPATHAFCCVFEQLWSIQSFGYFKLSIIGKNNLKIDYLSYVYSVKSPPPVVLSGTYHRQVPLESLVCCVPRVKSGEK